MVAGHVIQFTLDMNTGQIVLSFSEVVNVGLFDMSSISLQTAQTVYSISDIFIFSELALASPTDLLNNLSGIITFNLTQDDLVTLKLHPLLGSSGTTFATYDSAITVDSSGHPLVGAPNGSALQVNIIPDVSPPIIEQLTIDLNAGRFLFTFDEPVLLSSVDTNAIALVGPLYYFSEISASQPDPRTIYINISSSELLDLLEFVYGRRIDQLYYTPDFITDIYSNRIAAINVIEPIRATDFIPDTTPPSLVSFDLDMNEGLLSLNFSEAIRPETFSPEGITIQDAALSTYRFTLTSSSTFNATSSQSILVQLSLQDLNGVKATENTATSTTNTYVTISNQTITDPFYIPAAIIQDGSGLQVSRFVEDTVRPELISFLFGAVNGQVSLSLTFTEVVDSSSVRVNQILLSVRPGLMFAPGESYTLVSSTASPPDGTVINIPLTDSSNAEDLFFILNNLSPLGQSINTTYLSFSSTAASDPQGNPVIGIDSTMAMQVAQEPGDLIPPDLQSFSLNLNTQTLLLDFSEPVLPSSFDFSRLTFQETASGGASYTLTGGTPASISNTTFLIMLTSNDVNSLKAMTTLATSSSDTYISLERGLASDTGGLYVRPTILQALNFTQDTQSPQLIGFELSLIGSDPLILTFSETVLVSNININRFTLLGEPSRAAPSFTFQTATTLTLLNGPVIELRLNLADKAALQQLPGIATTINNTYLSVGTGAAVDAAGNSVVAIPEEEAIQASRFTPDILPPQITEFDINMNQGILVLRADEPIDEQSFNASAFTLQNRAVIPSASHSLSTSALNRLSDFSVLTVGISQTDLNALKVNGICTTRSVCFLIYGDGAIADTFGEEAVNITTGLSPSQFTADTGNPSLVTFTEFNRALGTITLTFSEPIIISTFNPSGVTLQSLTTGSADISTFTITGGIASTENVATVVIELSDEDMAAIRLNPFLCTSRGNCYITLTSSSFTDIAGNPLVAETVGQLTARFVLDDVPPMLTNFTLSIEDATLTLTFSEPVSAESFRVTGIGLQGAANTTTSYRLTNSFTTSQDGVVITINISDYDLNQLKASTFASSLADTYLTIDSTTIRDLALVPNQVMSVDSTNAISAQSYVSDTMSTLRDIESEDPNVVN